MCFGSSKNNPGDEQPPRPASGKPSYHALESKTTSSVPAQYQQQQQQRLSSSNDYAPPSGPPPAQRPPVNPAVDEFAPPPGPPPQHRVDDGFAPPSGPPPTHRPPVSSAADGFAPPPGPPPSHRPPVSSAGDDFAPPPGPPPQRLQASSADDGFAPPPGPPPSHRPPAASDDDFAPPPGPPPSHRHPAADDFAPPPGPPPSQRPIQNGMSYMAPPPGPPPGHDLSYISPPPGPPPSHKPAQDDLSYVAPPPGPPPAQAQKPQHDWEAVVPDTTLFPPPPSFFSGFERSPANNSTEAEAEAGEHWCAQHPLTAPVTLDPPSLAALHSHNPRLMQPAGFRGSLVCTAPGVWSVSTETQACDSTIIAYPPLYTVTVASPLSSPTRHKTIYYEVALSPATPLPRDGICLALGYTALPYPSFRMPGWHRGSLAVHGDDGHKFINDRWGGKEFTAPFKPGERLGVGMVFVVGPDGRIGTEVFFTRQGMEVGRWNLHEETDAEEDLPVTGLEGYHDLSCAIGTCGRVVFEVVLEPGRWMYRPVGY